MIGLRALTLSFAKTTRIMHKVRIQVRVETFDVFNSRCATNASNNASTSSADFGRINLNRGWTRMDADAGPGA